MSFIAAPGFDDESLARLLAETTRLSHRLEDLYEQAALVNGGGLTRGLRIREYSALKREVDQQLREVELLLDRWGRQQLPVTYLRGVYSGSILASLNPEDVLRSQIHRTATDIITARAHEDTARAVTSARNQLLAQFDESITLERMTATSAFLRADDPAQRALARQLLANRMTPEAGRRALIDHVWSQPPRVLDSAGRRWEPGAYARMLTRTQTTTAFNAGLLNTFALADVNRVLVRDGDSDAPCRTANGQVWSLRYAQSNVLQHPNCVRTFEPDVQWSPRDELTLADRAEAVRSAVRTARLAYQGFRVASRAITWMDQVWDLTRKGWAAGVQAGDEVAERISSEAPDNVIPLPLRAVNSPDDISDQLDSIVRLQQQISSLEEQLAMAVGAGPGDLNVGLHRIALAQMKAQNRDAINAVLSNVSPENLSPSSRLVFSNIVKRVDELEDVPLAGRAVDVAEELRRVDAPPSSLNPFIDLRPRIAPLEPERVILAPAPSPDDLRAMAHVDAVIQEMERVFSQIAVTERSTIAPYQATLLGTRFDLRMPLFQRFIDDLALVGSAQMKTGTAAEVLDRLRNVNSLLSNKFPITDGQRNLLRNRLSLLMDEVRFALEDTSDLMPRWFNDFDNLFDDVWDEIASSAEETISGVPFDVTAPGDWVDWFQTTLGTQTFSGSSGVNGVPQILVDPLDPDSWSLFIKPWRGGVGVWDLQTPWGLDISDTAIFIPAKQRLGWLIGRVMGHDQPFHGGTILFPRRTPSKTTWVPGDKAYWQGIELQRYMAGWDAVHSASGTTGSFFNALGHALVSTNTPSDVSAQAYKLLEDLTTFGRVMLRGDGHQGNSIVKVIDAATLDVKLAHVDFEADVFTRVRNMNSSWEQNLPMALLKGISSEIRVLGVTRTFDDVLDDWPDTGIVTMLRGITDQGGVPFTRVANWAKDPTWSTVATDADGINWGLSIFPKAYHAPLVIAKDGDQLGEVLAGVITQIFHDPDLHGAVRAITPEAIQAKARIAPLDAGSETVLVTAVRREQFDFLQALAGGELDDLVIDELLQAYIGMPGLTPGVTHSGVIDEWEEIAALAGDSSFLPDRLRNELLATVKSNLSELINHGAIVPDDVGGFADATLDFTFDTGVGQIRYQGDLQVGQVIDMTLEDAAGNLETVQAWVQHAWLDVDDTPTVGLFVLDNSKGPIAVPFPGNIMPDGWTYVQVKV